MKKSVISLILGFSLCPVLSLASQAQSTITQEAAHAIGVDAYIYFYPLISMEITRKQFTNIEPGKEFGKGPMNTFVNVPQYPPGDFKGVVAEVGFGGRVGRPEDLSEHKQTFG